MSKWLEIYFDVESEPDRIGDVREGLWCLVLWRLNKKDEPIINSSQILETNLTQKRALKIAKKFAKESKDKTYISGTHPKSKFPINPIKYELIAYDDYRTVKSE